MSKANHIKDILNHLQLSEKEKVEFDEEAIFLEVQKQHSEKSSLTIKILTILGGFFATLTFLGFLFIAGLYNSGIGLLLFGIGFITAAILFNKKYDKLLIDTLSISTYVIGFFLLGFGLDKLKADENLISFIFMIIAFCALFITQNYILSFISVLIVNGSILVLINSTSSYNLIHIYNSLMVLCLSYFMLNEAKIITANKKLAKLYNPIRTGLLFSLLMGLFFVGVKVIIPISSNYIWGSSIATILAVLYLISIILNIINIKKLTHKILIYSASFLILLPTAFSPAISGALLIILLSFLVSYKTGLTIGIISFIYFISQYYYDLNFTLLVKSEILFSSGILFLLFYFFTYKKLRTHEEI